MELRIPKETLLLIAEKWVNDNLVSPLRVADIRVDIGCGAGDVRHDLVLQLERVNENIENRDA